jgi:hypothetical protein
MVPPRRLDTAPDQGLTPRHLHDAALAKQRIDVWNVFFTLVETNLKNERAKVARQQDVEVKYE